MASLLSLGVLLIFPAGPSQAVATLEVYGTLHSMGIIVGLSAGDDPDQDAIPSVAYRISGSGDSYLLVVSPTL